MICPYDKRPCRVPRCAVCPVVVLDYASQVFAGFVILLALYVLVI
jgi:hypothetical protein